NLTMSMSRSNGVTSSYGYDPLGRITSITHAHGATALNTQTYGYDAAGNRNRQTTDIAQPLITQAASSTVDTENHLLSRGAVTYAYDLNGNRTSETSPSGSTTYAWDSRNRLQSIGLPGGTTITFRHDFAGNMISQASAGVTTNYLLDDLTNVVVRSDSTGQQ